LAADGYLGVTPPPKPPGGPPYEGGGRVGGDTFADAVVMPSWFYTDTGNTCGYADDYEVMCPYGSNSPDVVYRYDCTADMIIAVDLCASSYDTKVFVFDGPSTQNLVACNDDAGCGYSGWQSRIDDLQIEAGHSYYFVVDGYGGYCGDYVLSIADVLPCEVPCPAGALIEGEPPCGDGYVDYYNGGCQYDGWTPIAADADGAATVCGRSCTYSYSGLSYRDTDWYTATAGGPVTLTCTAEFPVLLLLIYGTDCSNLGYLYQTAGTCETASIAWDAQPGQQIWPWVGPSAFSGVSESGYVLGLSGLDPNVAVGACCPADGGCFVTTQTFCEDGGSDWHGGPCEPNPCDPTPVVETSWGKLKALHR
jgi:hypothetical protein